MRVLRHIFHNSRNRVRLGGVIVQKNGLLQGISVWKVFIRLGARHHNTAGSRKCRLGVALIQLDFQDIKSLLVGQNKVLFKSVLVLSTYPHSSFASTKNLNGIDFPRLGDFWKIGLERIGKGQLKMGALHHFALDLSLKNHPVDLVLFCIVLIITDFVSDKKSDQKAGGNTYGKASNLDEREELVLFNGPPGNI